jgi:hypothetical protein
MRDRQANSNDLMLYPLIRCFVFRECSDCFLGRFILSTGFDSRLVHKMQKKRKKHRRQHTRTCTRCESYMYMHIWCISCLIIRANLR